MWHNQEIMTGFKDSFMTEEEFKEKEVMSRASSHEPPFHPYYQAAMEEGKRLLANSNSETDSNPSPRYVTDETRFAGKTYEEWKGVYKDLGNTAFYDLLAARYHNLTLGEVTSYHIGSTHRAWLEWREANADSK